MAQAKTWAAFNGVVAATLERESGELRVQRLPGGSDAVVEFVAGLPGSVRATSPGLRAGADPARCERSRQDRSP